MGTTKKCNKEGINAGLAAPLPTSAALLLLLLAAAFCMLHLLLGLFLWCSAPVTPMHLLLQHPAKRTGQVLQFTSI